MIRGLALRGAAAVHSPGSPLPASAWGVVLGGSCWDKSRNENNIIFFVKCLLPAHAIDLYERHKMHESSAIRENKY